jgi:hypothetical protein
MLVGFAHLYFQHGFAELLSSFGECLGSGGLFERKAAHYQVSIKADFRIDD